LISRLYAILDAETAARAGWTLTDLARAYIEGGARLLQVRAKQASSGAFLETASAIVALAQTAGAIVIVNDRPDIARLAGAAGVHVGQDDLPPRAARAIVGDAAVVGLSTHTGAQLERAAIEPISYAAVGPVFPTATKSTGYQAVGLEMVRRAAGAGPAIVGIGGITRDNAAAVIEAGAASVAVITDLLSTGDPAGRVREFLSSLAHV
jgi:thiamine-phosphate pyrophosphorylase